MRYALYYAPTPSSLLWELGCKWLGRDAMTGQKIKQNYFPNIGQNRLYELTRTPRRYGLHATLKAPFKLAAEYNMEMLQSAARDFSVQRYPIILPPLVLRQINDFFCLCPEKQAIPLEGLAEVCVQKFDKFRAPMTSSERARSRADILTPMEKQNLMDWGYPYVFEQFRFHITLTARIIDDFEKEVMQAVLSDMFAPVLGQPIVMDAICLFLEPYPGQPFVCTDRFPFSRTYSIAKEFMADSPDEKYLYFAMQNS